MQWTKCQESMPNEEQEVIVYSQDTGEYAIATHSGGRWLSDSDLVDGSEACSVVSHWMPVPQPPR